MSQALPKSMAFIAGGTIVAQVINILGFMLATRFISPVEFGIYGIHMAISAPLSLLATGRYEVAFIRAGQLAKVANLFVLSIAATFVSTILAMGALYAIFGVFLLKSEVDVQLVCLLLLGQALVNCTTQLNNYTRSYGVIAISRILGALGSQLAIVGLALAGKGHYALGIGMALGMLMSAALSLWGNAGWLNAGLKTVSIARMQMLARRNVAYIMYNGPQALASAFQDSAAVAVITAFFGHAATGIYVLANRLMRAPISIVAESIGRVLQRQFADMARGMDMRKARFLRASIGIVSAIGLAFLLGVWTMALPVVSIAFGPQWASLGDMVVASAPYYAAYLVAATLAPIPLATEDYRPMAILGVLGSGFYVLLLALAGLMTNNLNDAFIIVSVGMAIYFSIFVGAVYYFVVWRHT